MDKHALTIGAELEPVSRVISFEKIREYARDGNIHSDDKLAKEQGLRGALVEGGHLVALITELMVNHFGKGFVQGGTVSVKFVAPVRPGDQIRARGVVSAIEQIADGRRVECEVWIEVGDGQKAVVGEASALLN